MSKYVLDSWWKSHKSDVMVWRDVPRVARGTTFITPDKLRLFLEHYYPDEAKRLDENVLYLSRLTLLAKKTGRFLRICKSSFYTIPMLDSLWDKPKPITYIDDLVLGHLEKINIFRGWTRSNMQVVGFPGKVLYVFQREGFCTVKLAGVLSPRTGLEETSKPVSLD